MTKSWVWLALLSWAIVATLLLFIKKDCNICASENSVIVRTKFASQASQPVLDGGVYTGTKVLNTTASYRGHVNVAQSSEHRHLSDVHQQLAENLVGYISEIFNNQESTFEKEGFTMIMLTYKR